MKFKFNILIKTNLIFLQGLGVLLFFLSSCSYLSQLPKGDKLYTGAVLKLESNEKVNTAKIKSFAKEAILPEPNKCFFGIRPQLWMYMKGTEKPESKFFQWLKKRGDEPVLMSRVKPQATAAIIDAKLFNIGIFNSVTSYKIIEKKHTASVVYTSYIHKPYIIKELTYAISNDSLSAIILADKDNSYIIPGNDYQLELLKNERIRIDVLLKNKGYFYFNPDYLLFKADTSITQHTITFKMTLKEEIPANALKAYRINKVIINQNYSLSEGASDSISSSFNYENNVFVGRVKRMKIEPKVILRSVYLKKNEIYSRDNHNITLNRLMLMGSFKFVQIKFADSDTTASNYLDVNILMTPMLKYTLRTELDLVSKSNDYSGPRMNLSLQNRNTFKGAELLNMSLAGSFESQLGSNNHLYSYSLNPQVELTFPRFLVPFGIHTNGMNIPKTRFLVSYNYNKKVNYFNINTLQLLYGYKWKNNVQQEHELNPISISYSTLSNKTDTFIALLNANPFLKKSYEEQFIVGGSYSFTFNGQLQNEKKLQYFFQLRTETAGNLFSLLKSVSGEKISSVNPSKVVGSIYSQYAKLSVEARSYYMFEDKNKVAMRLFAGVADAYGNSSILPYSKQFFCGGPNSIRAFQTNSLGPGAYLQNANSNTLLQLGGDVKLELNAEYRFNIYKYFKGALFMDAGNVWLQKSNPSGIGTPFLFSNFINELAVGAGLGLRVDVSFFVLRFDLAMPLRKPWLPDSNRWVINQVDFSSQAWRAKNLVLNIAIGYPF